MPIPAIDVVPRVASLSTCHALDTGAGSVYCLVVQVESSRHSKEVFPPEREFALPILAAWACVVEFEATCATVRCASA